VSRFQNSDFEKLALPLLDPLYNFARWMNVDADEAQDLVQDTFVKALKGLDSFQPGTNFRAWMFRILQNTLLTNRTRLERRKPTREDEDGFEKTIVTQESPEVALIRQADRELIKKAITEVSPVLREVLLLADIEEMKYQEVADALGIPIGTVMSRLARARKQVREQLLQAVGGKT
jgi:RNA polymerase sigma-70 factor (ECF subfamily)